MYSALKAPDPSGKDAFQADYLRGALTVPPGMRKGVEGHLFAGAKQATLAHDEAHEQGARRLRQLHDASIGFVLDDAIWQSPTKLPSEEITERHANPNHSEALPWTSRS